MADSHEYLGILFTALANEIPAFLFPFTTEIEVTTICQKCYLAKKAIEEHLMLTVPHDKQEHIESCVTNCFAPEILSMDNAVYCNRCKVKTPTKRTSIVKRAAKILILFVKSY